MKFLNIYNQDKKLLKSIKKDINKVIVRNNFILGKEVEVFEKNFSEFLKIKYTVGCGNGTDAIYLALKSLNLPKHSEVILPAMTYCSTAFAVINAGLKPVLIDIAPRSSTICTNQLRKKINNKTKCIILVHLYGQTCNISEVKKIIGGKKIYIIEDAAQAHGAYDCNSCNKYNKKKCCKMGPKAGSLGDISCFSFYPGKNLGAYGDAGAICTNDKNIYNKLLLLRNLGSNIKYHHEIVGMNSRLDTIQSVILNNKIKLLNTYNNKRREIAKIYNKNILNKNIEKLNYNLGCVFHQYVIIVKKVKKFENFLIKNKIPYGRHYPFALHQLQALRKIFKNLKFPNSEKLAAGCISLPIDPLIRSKDIIKICKKINLFN